MRQSYVEDNGRGTVWDVDYTSTRPILRIFDYGSRFL